MSLATVGFRGAWGPGTGTGSESTQSAHITQGPSQAPLLSPVQPGLLKRPYVPSPRTVAIAYTKPWAIKRPVPYTARTSTLKRPTVRAMSVLTPTIQSISGI